MKNIFFKVIKTCLLVSVVFLGTSDNSMIENKVNNNNLNKTVNLSTMSLKVEEFDYDELYSAKDTYTGDLTGYVYNCPLCGGTLGCAYTYNIKDGTTTYPDKTYGEVYIVASSSNLSCGSVIRFESKRISDKPVYAIVLDRGVLGNDIDFLSPSEEYALKLGRSTIIRNGW